jgi:hypothetical protein
VVAAWIILCAVPGANGPAPLWSGSPMKDVALRHGRACPGHPRLVLLPLTPVKAVVQGPALCAITTASPAAHPGSPPSRGRAE